VKIRKCENLKMRKWENERKGDAMPDLLVTG
jgi:hypothetical protein